MVNWTNRGAIARDEPSTDRCPSHAFIEKTSAPTFLSSWLGTTITAPMLLPASCGLRAEQNTVLGRLFNSMHSFWPNGRTCLGLFGFSENNKLSHVWLFASFLCTVFLFLLYFCRDMHSLTHSLSCPMPRWLVLHHSISMWVTLDAGCSLLTCSAQKWEMQK